MGLFLAQASVFFRDMEHIWSPIVLALFYLTPVLYSMDILPDTLAWLIRHFNPMYYYISIFRDFTGIYPMPNVWVYVFRGAVISLLFLVTGSLCFIKTKDKFILHI